VHELTRMVEGSERVFVMWVGRRVRSISTVESMCGYGSSAAVSV
jgi:mevalonate kinase